MTLWIHVIHQLMLLAVCLYHLFANMDPQCVTPLHNKAFTKDIIRSVCESDLKRFRKLATLSVDFNCDIEYYAVTYPALKRVIPFYTVGGMSERRRPMSLLAASSIRKNTIMTQVCIKKRMETLLRPLSSEDMLFVIDHSTLGNFQLICSKFRESFVNAIICFERALPPVFDDGELMEPSTETVRTSPTRVLIDSLRIWCDIDSFYDTKSPSQQAVQVRKLTYLVKMGGKLDWAGYPDTSITSLLGTLLHQNESYAFDKLLDWKIAPCSTRDSIIFIETCVELNHRTILLRLLREPTMDLWRNPGAPLALLSHSWISITPPLKAQILTDIIVTHNYVFDHGSVYMLHRNDTSKRITQLFDAGVDIIDSTGLLNAPLKLEYTHPGLNIAVAKNIVNSSCEPRTLVTIARLTVKRAIGPCKTGKLPLKLNTLAIPTYVKNYISQV